MIVPDCGEASIDRAAIRQTLLARARTLAPLRERAEACEAQRCVPLESVQDFIRAGFKRASPPARCGDAEVAWMRGFAGDLPYQTMPRCFSSSTTFMAASPTLVVAPSMVRSAAAGRS